MCLAAEFATDLHEFDPADLRWRVLNTSSGVAGKAPSVRSGHGFTAMGGELYVFGGTDRRGYSDNPLGWGLVGARPSNSFGLLIRAYGNLVLPRRSSIANSCVVSERFPCPCWKNCDSMATVRPLIVVSMTTPASLEL